MAELLPRLKALLVLAKGYDIGLNIDAEEAERLEISLDLVEALALDPELAGGRIGFVVQAFQRAPFVLDWLLDLARRSGLRFMVRLVKGAYWDTEVKRAQVEGMDGYPVYTRKVHTDISYLACARKLLAHPELVYPQPATHNASTLSAVVELAQGNRDFEFQCLHGMGETLYDKIVGEQNMGLACRIYAPVGTHETLLAYLVRRLLENGANSSFVNQIVDPEVPLDRLVEDPVTASKSLGGSPHPRVPMPSDVYPDRRNSRGIDLTNELALAELERALNGAGNEALARRSDAWRRDGVFRPTRCDAGSQSRRYRRHRRPCGRGDRRRCRARAHVCATGAGVGGDVHARALGDPRTRRRSA